MEYTIELPWNMTFFMCSGRSTIRSSLFLNNFVSISLTVTDMCAVGPLTSLLSTMSEKEYFNM